MLDVILAAILALAIASSPPTGSGLVGLWESTKTSQGGLGHAMEFRPDGPFVEATVVIVEMPYRVSGDRLIIGEEPSGPDGAKGKSATFRFDGDALLETDPAGSVLRRERLPGQPARPSSVVGDWRYCHYVGVIAYQRFTEAGKLLLRLPMTSSTGRYALEGDALTLSGREQPDARFKAVVQGENLVVSDGKGGPAEYRREPTGAWYDLGRVEKCSPAMPVAAAPTAPPSSAAQSDLPPARSHPPIESFVGLWRNVDPETRSWTKVKISAKNDTLSVHIWGKCHPSDCDLGLATAKYKGSPIVLFADEGYVKRRFTLWLEDDTLRITTASHFTDQSGRPDSVSEGTFRK